MAICAMFVDRIKVFAQAGKGGRGCVSFRREKFVPKGGPDGGDGGRGGDIILRADQHTDHLAHLFYEPIIKAKNGGHGRGKTMHGKNAPDKIVKVPIGTIVYRIRNADSELRMREEESENLRNTGDGRETEADRPRMFDEGKIVNQSTTRDPQTTMDMLADVTRDQQEFLLCTGCGSGKGK